MSSFRIIAAKSLCLVTRRNVSSGVVRVVKPATLSSGDVEGVAPSRAKVIPLMHRNVPEEEKSGKVPLDVRIADIFRQYSRNPRDKDVLLSVLQNLSALGTPEIVQFPGFVKLVSEMSLLLNDSVFSYDEVSSLVSNLRAIGVVRASYNPNGIDFGKLGEGLSNQLLCFLDSVPPSGLFDLVSEIQVSMKINLDKYFYWSFTKAMLPWARGEGVSSDDEYVRVVLGNLQLLTSPQLFKRAHSLLDSVEVQAKIVDLIHRNKLSVVLLIELLHNLQPIKATMGPVIQAAISSIITNHPQRIESNLDDLATVLSLGTSEFLETQKIASCIEKHFDSSPDKVDLLLQCVADFNYSECVTLITRAADLASKNLTTVHDLPPNKAANLYYLFAKTGAVCEQLESVVVGRLPAIAPPQLSKLVLAFASGTNKHVYSFKALQGTVRHQIDKFESNDFADAIYGLAYAGLLTKSVLQSASAHVSQVRRCDLPRFLWALAVANYTVPACWEIGINRLNFEILSEPSVLEMLTSEDERMIYETLVAVSVLQLGVLPAMAQRRKSQFENKWTSERTKVDYPQLLTELNIEFKDTFKSQNVDKMLHIPLYLPRHKLVLDINRDGVIHPTSGATMGSAALKHALWASKGLNVVAISDDRAEHVATIIEEFVAELGLGSMSDKWPERGDGRKMDKRTSNWVERSHTSNEDTTWASRKESSRLDETRTSNSWASRT